MSLDKKLYDETMEWGKVSNSLGNNDLSAYASLKYSFSKKYLQAFSSPGFIKVVQIIIAFFVITLIVGVFFELFYISLCNNHTIEDSVWIPLAKSVGQQLTCIIVGIFIGKSHLSEN